MNDKISLFLNNFNYIETERLILRPFKSDDFNDFYEIVGDERNFSFTGNGIGYDALESSNLLKSYLDLENAKIYNVINMGIVLKENNKLIGILNLIGRFNMPIGDMACILNNNFHNKGYMSEAVKKVIDFSFNKIYFHRLSVELAIENKASLRVVEKCGLSLEGIKKDDYYINGKFYDVGCFGIINE